ncbi:MAG: endonuclease [Bacteroidetes bacterium CG02_land_8_20_14_3_00_31_25]|nr:endonuclease/exonuclease/phosphatase family protein [Bacteroidota bacterium]PIV62000.1 MAG: endonuclease [Bacteroidetes bacterium CG02_land_8_20_14_3_00_31_25]PIY03978.1 MAG: endonuclease [Bacteroidetes bacterium CG_4_10_14_3_um_filter_31_20]
MVKLFWVSVLLILLNINTFSQEKKYKALCVAFYNLENFFDTINDPNKNDEEFLPNGKNNWNTKKYNTKIEHNSEVITQIADEIQAKGPVIIGVSEVENKNVLEDLIVSPLMAPLNYGYVLVEGPDKRGVDVALLYQKKYFTVTNVRSATLRIPGKTDWFTRDQLVVTGNLDGEKFNFIVNHWPSRSGGEKRSAPLRNAAADLCKSLADSIYKSDPNAKIIIMGDLNDDPTNKSLTQHLQAKGNVEELKSGDLFNPMYNLFVKDGIGSLAYRDKWDLFDQIIVSQPLLEKDKSSYRFLHAKIFNKNFLVQKDGAFAGYPFRTYVAGNWMGGYSDHFPAYIILVKEKY